MFEIKSENQHGTFHVKLHRTLNPQEIMQLAALAANIIHKVETTTVEYSASSEEITFSRQVRLGESPVNSIIMGSYVEPDAGVRIRMLHYPEKKVDAVKAFRKHTGISLVGCKDIVCGNYICPILTRETADKILHDFKQLEVYATIVDGQRKGEVVG